jgi:nitrate reductase delta subunit
MKTLKALAALLAYPEATLIEALPEILQTLKAEKVLDPIRIDSIAWLADELAHDDLLDLQERYVALFDRTRTLSLHLFEHVHGDGRERGRAMVELAETYLGRGLMIDGNELPDYLPLFLEYLSVIDRDEARELLGQIGHINQAIRDRLIKRGAAYAAVFDALLALADHFPAPAAVTEDVDADDFTAIDRAWEDAEVLFGPAAAPQGSSCGKAEEILRRMQTS